MPYRKLYKLRQDANGDSQPLNWYVADAKSLNWVDDVAIRASDAMPIDGLRGFIVRHAPRQPNGLTHDYTIVVAEGLEPRMERFVVIKELMHCYFEVGDGTATDSEIILDSHMRQFFGQSASSQSLHVKAEYTALWMAMGVLCPERRRAEYRRQLKHDEITLDAIIGALKTPSHIVQRLLSDQFEDEIRDILN